MNKSAVTFLMQPSLTTLETNLAYTKNIFETVADSI